MVERGADVPGAFREQDRSRRLAMATLPLSGLSGGSNSQGKGTGPSKQASCADHQDRTAIVAGVSNRYDAGLFSGHGVRSLGTQCAERKCGERGRDRDIDTDCLRGRLVQNSTLAKYHDSVKVN